MIGGRKYQIGEGVEVDLPNRPIDGIRCVILELWETKESVPYAKLKPLMREDVTDNMFEMLTTVGIRGQDIKLMDGVQELFEVDMDATAIIDSGATRTIVPNDSYLVRNLHIDGGEMSYHVDDGLVALEPAGGVPVTQFCLCRHGIIGINGDKHSQYHLWDLLGPGG